MYSKSVLAAVAAMIAAGLLGVAPAAKAAQWATVGAGCVPAGQTSQADLHFATAGRTNFNVGKTGEIVLTCPITARLGIQTKFSLLYQDPDGQGTATRVRATLRRMNWASGTVSTIAVLDSNSNSGTTLRTLSRNLGPSGCGEYEFNNNDYYYVQINMQRASSGQGVSFAAVSVYTPEC